MIAPRALIELVRSSRLASRVPYAYAAVAHDVSRLVFTAGACPLDESRSHHGTEDTPPPSVATCSRPYPQRTRYTSCWRTMMRISGRS